MPDFNGPDVQKNAQQNFRNRYDDLVCARWTDDGRVVLRFPDTNMAHVVTEQEAEDMFDRGDLIGIRKNRA